MDGKHEKLDGYIVPMHLSVFRAMEAIERNGKGIVYVCEGHMLKGVLTDGDVRRHILKGGSLQEPVSAIANRSPKHLQEENKGQAYELMRRYQIRSVPILDNRRMIVQIVFLQEELAGPKEQINVPVVIMAGGKGTRLYPYTQILPKPLIPIGEKTITEHIMDRFGEYGCNQFTMIVNYKRNFIKSYFLDQEKYVDLSFVDETEFMGTGGGLKLLEGRYSSTFFMSNCDILIDGDYSDILRQHKEQGNIATMVCARKHVTIPYGTVDTSDSGQAMRLNEKPELTFVTNTGLYVLEPEFLERIPDNTFIHITDVIQSCIDSGESVGVYQIAEDDWLDMGQLDELERMKRRLETH